MNGIVYFRCRFPSDSDAHFEVLFEPMSREVRGRYKRVVPIGDEEFCMYRRHFVIIGRPRKQSRPPNARPPYLEKRVMVRMAVQDGRYRDTALGGFGQSDHREGGQRRKVSINAYSVAN